MSFETFPFVGLSKTYSLDYQVSDSAATATLEFDRSSISIAERGFATAVAVVRRSGSPVGAVSVDYTTTDGTAIAPGDYATAAGTLSWADGDGTDKTFSVSVVDDGTLESSENVALSLSNALGVFLAGET